MKLNSQGCERRTRSVWLNLLSLIVSFWVSDLLAVDCSQADITLSTQQAVDDFQAKYGGGNICDRVTQNLYVVSSSNISNLDGLANLTSVGGGLSIGNNKALTNLAGLSILTSVGGTLQIYRNDTLINLVGLSSLTSVGGDFNIVDNPALTDLEGLLSLTSVSGQLQIEGNRVLTHLDGLSGLTNVGRDVLIYFNGLTNLDGFSGLTGMAGGLSISGNAALTNLNGLSGLISLGGGLYIHRNGLTNLDGLSSLTSVGDLTISYSAGLTDLDGLSSLTSVGGLSIDHNAVLTDLTGLSALTSLDRSLVIDGNDALKDLDGLDNLTSLGGGLRIEDNAALTNLDGLTSLTSVGGGLYIVNSAVLTDLTGLSNLTNLGALYIGRTEVLTNLNGLSGLTSLDWDLWIYDNATLANLDGLSNLTSVGGNLVIDDNATLIDLDGLSSLTSMAGNVTNASLTIENNAALNNLDGLSGLTSMIGILTIDNNAALVNLDGLSNLIGVSDFLYIENNDALTNLNGLSGITSVGRLSIDSNAMLTNLDGLSNLSSVGSRGFFIVNNAALTNLDGLSSLTSVAGELHIENNAALTNLDGLSSLTSVDHGLVIFESDALTNLDGLSSLTSVYKLLIESNASLTDLDGLSNLTSVSSWLGIVSNPKLTNVDGLAEFAYVGTILSVHDNSLLGNCSGLVQLLDLVDDYAPGPGPGEAGIPDVGGDVLVESNLAGCNSVEEILPAPDQDGDGIPDAEDNCPAVANAGQADKDGDGIGDACDPQDDTDTDQDGVRDGIDNCPAVTNPNQADANNNGIGDACEQTSIVDQQSEVVKAFEATKELEGDCRGVAEINGVLLAQIHVDEYGCELWKLDDAQGHSLFADINPGPVESVISPNFGYYEPYNGWIYFGAYDGFEKRMWRTDGQVAEKVEETEVVPGGFQTIPTSRADFNGRYYFLASSTAQQTRFYSLDDAAIRPEPQTPLAANGHIYRVLTLFDKLVMTITDDEHGVEPWVFDGNEFRILQDIVAGPESALSPGYPWFYVDESWVFSARYLIGLGIYQSAYFRTDGVAVEKLPHTGPWMEPIMQSGSIYTSDATYGVNYYYPGNGDTGLPVLRVGKESTSAYKLPLDLSRPSDASMAILGGDVLALNHNRLFKLGETSAVELSFSLPTDWDDSVFGFVGSGDYYSHAYVKETGKDGKSRVWVWNFTEAGLLMAGEDNVVTHAEYFRHIGNDIYFYGEDEQVGMALRRIPDALIKPVPRLGAVTGSWYDPATSGQGFVLHPIDDQYTVISFYGFENNGKPLWLTGVGQQQLKPGYTTEIAMNITSGGNFGSFTPGQITEEPWGTLKLTFETCSKATAEFDGLSGQQTMHMVRLAGLEGINCYYSTPPAPEAAGITGSWYDPATSGQGLVLHPMNDQQMIVSFYGYKNNSERLWLIGAYDGQITRGEALVIDMITASGGRFGGFTPEDITESPWGTLTINFVDCDSATATLDGVDGQQTMHMVKLAGLQGSGLDCH